MRGNLIKREVGGGVGCWTWEVALLTGGVEKWHKKVFTGSAAEHGKVTVALLPPIPLSVTLSVARRHWDCGYIAILSPLLPLSTCSMPLTPWFSTEDPKSMLDYGVLHLRRLRVSHFFFIPSFMSWIPVNLVTSILHVDMRVQGDEHDCIPFPYEPEPRMILFTFLLTHFSWRQHHLLLLTF